MAVDGMLHITSINVWIRMTKSKALRRPDTPSNIYKSSSQEDAWGMKTWLHTFLNLAIKVVIGGLHFPLALSLGKESYFSIGWEVC
jgi:hypothetical protein